MPDQPDEDLVPPLKVMRKRLNGVYRADTGFSGPTRRYVLIVALLVGLASVPTLAAITAGSNELADGKTDTMDIPFLPPASPGPVRGSAPSSDGSSGLGVVPPPPGGAEGVADAVVRAGRLMGSAGRLRPMVGAPSPGTSASPSRASSSRRAHTSGSDKSAESGSKETGNGPSMAAFPALPGLPVVPRLPSVGGRSAGRDAVNSDPPDKSDDGSGSAVDDDAGSAADDSAGSAADDSAGSAADDAAGSAVDDAASDPDPDSRDDDDQGAADGDQPSDQGGSEPGGSDEPPAWATRPSCHERGKCGTKASRHHRPDWSRHRQCEHSNRRAHWSNHRSGEIREVTVRIEPTGRHAQQPQQVIRSQVRHRSSGRSEHSRRSAVAERPQNIRAVSILQRSYDNGGHNNVKRHIPEARGEDNQIASRSYRGSHRAGSMHHADDQTPAQRRSSRVGRHHAESTEDLSGRW